MQIVRRGYKPRDYIEFGEKYLSRLNTAAVDLEFLLNRGYDTKAASVFVSNHYLLTQRQRMALARILSPRASLEGREAKRLRQAPEPLVLDGFNTLITLEVALSDSLLVQGLDGTIRDLAGVRGTYRVIDKTVGAVKLLLDHLEAIGVKEALFYLDEQVSNTGRLTALLEKMNQGRNLKIEVALDLKVDAVLSGMENVVTSDAIILDRCVSWYNLNAPLIRNSIPNAWIFTLEEIAPQAPTDAAVQAGSSSES